MIPNVQTLHLCHALRIVAIELQVQTTHLKIGSISQSKRPDRSVVRPGGDIDFRRSRGEGATDLTQHSHDVACYVRPGAVNIHHQTAVEKNLPVVRHPLRHASFHQHRTVRVKGRCSGIFIVGSPEKPLLGIGNYGAIVQRGGRYAGVVHP